MTRLKTFQERLKTNDFPDPAPWKDPSECQAAYEAGMPFVSPDPDGEEELADYVNSHGGEFNGEALAYESGIQGAADGKDIVLLYQEAYKASGRDGWIVGNPSQQVGDCVSHSTRNALMLSLACQVTSGNGGWPEIPDASYEKMTGFTTVPLYLTRSNAPSHGWSCPTSVSNAQKYVGMVVAQDYSDVPGVGVDYSKYSGSQTTKFGRGFPPESYLNPLADHKVISSTKVSGLDQLLDYLGAGYGISTCGGESWATGSNARNSDGYAKRTNKGWSHALCYYGFIRSKEWMDKYNEVGIIIGNSWGSSSCGGNRKIMGRDDLPLLPKNCWIAKWSECKKRSLTAISAVAGWKPAKLRDWGESIQGLI